MSCVYQLHRKHIATRHRLLLHSVTFIWSAHPVHSLLQGGNKMSSPGELRELRNAFDRFSVWILARNAAHTNTSLRLVHGKNIHPQLCNYMVALTSDRDGSARELALLEFHLTKAQFEAVSKSARQYQLERVIDSLKLPATYSLQHYLYIANEVPPIEATLGLTRLTNGDLNPFDLSLMPTNALCLISAAREQCDAISKNVYEITLRNDGQTVRELLQQIPSQAKKNKSSEKPPVPITPKPVNGIKLEDLSSQLKPGERQAPEGLFLVRQAQLEDIRRYVKKDCVDRFEDVTQAIRFLVSESVPFEGTTFPDHQTVHEVAYVQDYGMVFWLRSRGPAKSSVGKHFTVSCWNEYDAVPPAPGWLNVLVSNETDGSTTHLQRHAESVKRHNPFKLIVLLQAADVMKVLQQPDEAVLDKLCSLFGVQSDEERAMVATTVQLELLIDHAIADNGSDMMAQTLVNFLNSIDESISQRMTVWIVGDDLLWTCVATTCAHSAIKHVIPTLEEDQWKACLSQMLTKQNSDAVESIAERIVASNSRSVGPDHYGNLFVLSALSESVNEEPTSSCWWIDAMERYVWRHIAPRDSKELDDLEQLCYERMFDDSTDPTQHCSSRSPIMHRTLQTLLAATYLTKHPQLIDIEKYRRLGWKNLIDLLPFRHSSVARAVLHHDLDAVRESAPEALTSIADCWQRNLLHVVHNAKEIGDALLAADVPFDQPCAAQLNSWTPILMAVDRSDWPLVDSLLAQGANLSNQDSKLHTMPQSELAQVVCDCIAEHCPALIEWILDQRPDYRINQQTIYTVSVFEEQFHDRELVFRLLTLAQEQGLPAREPPYRYIFDNTALDNAVEDDRIEMAIFLVERLHFEPTEAFQALRARYQQNSQLKDYKRMFELCREGELEKVKRMIEEHGLDPQCQYDGSNLLIQAAASGNVALVQYLYETCGGFEARLDECDEHGCSALSEALVGDHQPIVQWLLARNATVNPEWIKQYPGKLPDEGVEVDVEDFLSLVACDRAKLERLAIDYGRYESGELLLHCYIRYVDEPDDETFRFLLSQYDNVDVRTDGDGETPLHIALQSGNKRCREMLLAAGADIYAKSLKHGLTSLHYAIMGGADRPFLTRLIDGDGFDVNVRDERGRTISFYMSLNTDLYCWLIDQHQFDPCARDNEGRSLLHHRVIRNSFFARTEIEYLLKMPQFSPSQTDRRGRLPLHYAVEMDNLTIVQLLLKYRPDLCGIPDGDGVTPMQLARNLNHSTVFEFLARSSANANGKGR
ncbi:uncharacterized protein LOC118502837 isoform X1 [Anopheles stephensi]|uniref:uncharacterized protein LOC118502837 isoform X1 n=1 Tax=Anopheles stephensi TaxID=30069 RepID=UPI00165888DE|nr:uncharacterized protein LOC118502837 isoform X1 [Anopheles stephensi]